jgi:transposase-like protein
MIKTQRKRYTAEFKARLALEVVKGQRTLNEIASEHGIHPNLLVQWKQRLLEQLPDVFADRRCKDEQKQEEREAQLYQQIGQLKCELDWLKKKAGFLDRHDRRERLGR